MCSICQRDPSFKSKHRNATSFKPGPDSRRHAFTREEQRRGYACLLDGGRNNPPAYAVAWVYRRIRSHYRQQRHFAECPF